MNNNSQRLAFDNFLTGQESSDILGSLINHNGSKGPHWADANSFWGKATSFGIPVEVKGRYNRWAFLATSNMIWSDAWGALSEFISDPDAERAIMKLAHALLTDADRNFDVRGYFGI